MQHPIFARKRTVTLSLGFTIVELLIVIVVIAILAAITIVAYNGIAQNAARSTLRNDTAQSVRILQNYHTTNSGFPTTLASISGGLPSSSDTTYEYTATASTFCLTATSVRAQISYYVNESNVIAEGTCSGHFGLNLPPLEPDDMLAAGYYHACTLAYDEQPYCWGRGTDGQLGRNSSVSSNVPVAVDTTGALAGKRVTALAAGQNHTCALANGQAYCWGNQTYCQLGLDGCSSFDTGNPDVLVPSAVSTAGVLAGKTLTKISVGTSHSCALSDENEVFCWGGAQYGKLGGGFGSHFSTTVSMPRSATAGSIVEGKTITSLTAGDDVTCVVADGAGYCWGIDTNGALGNGPVDTGLSLELYTNVAIAVDTSGVLSGKTLTYISSSNNYDTTCAIADGAAYCWGSGTSGQLGDGLLTASESPVAVDATGVLAGKTVSSINVGDLEHVCSLADGAGFCWGNNQYYGMTGDGTTTTPRATPVATLTSGALSGKTLAAIKGGYNFTCALSTDNDVYCWGLSTDGRLGAGAAGNTSSPRIVTSPL